MTTTGKLYNRRQGMSEIHAVTTNSYKKRIEELEAEVKAREAYNVHIDNDRAALQDENERLRDNESVVKAHWDVLPLDFKLVYELVAGDE